MSQAPSLYNTPSHREHLLPQVLSCSVIQVEQKMFPDGIITHTWMIAANSSRREAKADVIGEGLGMK